MRPVDLALCLAVDASSSVDHDEFGLMMGGLADAFRARVVDATTESFVFEMTGSTEKLDAFVALMRPLGLAEVSRTGVAAIARGTRVI